MLPNKTPAFFLDYCRLWTMYLVSKLTFMKPYPIQLKVRNLRRFLLLFSNVLSKN